jgi:hypothetical protein
MSDDMLMKMRVQHKQLHCWELFRTQLLAGNTSSSELDVACHVVEHKSSRNGFDYGSDARNSGSVYAQPCREAVRIESMSRGWAVS